MSSKVMTGLDVFEEDNYWKKLIGYRIGILSNQASLNRKLEHVSSVINRLLPGHIKALFGPQHGYSGEDQDNMIETPHSFHKRLKVPIFSLYSKTRIPTQEMLDLIDVLVIDLQDVGTRVYTFSSTILNCLRSCSEQNKMVVVLDRPNPVGGEKIEGNLLDPELYSFVGPFSLPMRHGLTIGELALLFNRELKIKCDLQVVPMKGWQRHMLWNETGLRWIMPSPNMPLPDTAMVYPGQVIWEGTNLSEGRGTCRPFEIFGAPYLDVDKIKKELSSIPLKGCFLQEFSFKPTFNKWAGKICHGFFIHVLDPSIYEPYFTSLCILQTVIKVHPEYFSWKSPPYEYEYNHMPIDLILGRKNVRLVIEKNYPLALLKKEWEKELKEYMKLKQEYHIYC